MARDIDKLLKIERLGEAPKLTVDTYEIIPTAPILDLANIEAHSEPKINMHIDLGLDQLEEQKE